MSEAAQRLKTDGSLAGQPCGWCQAPLQTDDDAAVCSACGIAHHARCWDNQLGCSKADCLNAPLTRLDKDVPPSRGSQLPPAGMPGSVTPPRAEPPPGFMFCPSCRNPILAGSQVCDLCGAITSPDGIYHGAKENAPGAVAALVCGIIGILFCQIILGPVALINASKAKSIIRSDPRYGGEGMATAGMVLGIIDIVLFVLALIVKFGSL